MSPTRANPDRVSARPAGDGAGRARNLAGLLDESAARGSAEYLVDGDRRITFTGNRDAAHVLAAVLADRYGIGRGDRVAICAANSADWLTVFWASAALGAVTVAMNSRWAAPEAAHALRLTEPALVVADAPRRALLDSAGECGAGAAAVLPIEEVGELAAGPCTGRVRGGLDAGEDEPATILFTSGTTGRAKGVVHSHRSLLATTDRQRTPRIDDPAARRYLLATPLFHVAALHNLAVPRLALGDAAVIVRGRFDIDRVTSLIEREGITHWSAVPTMAVRLLDLLDADPPAAARLRSLRALSLITAPAPAALQRRLRERVPGVRTALAATYGLTETASPVTAADDADLRADPLCVGAPVQGMQVQVRDSGGRALPRGVGGVWARGPHLMSGYWRNPDATRGSFDADGWLRTGDIGEFVGGRLRVHSRRTDLIIRGGENVYPAEVEAVLEAHPGVAEALVHAREHPEWGQEVCAIIVPRAGEGAEASPQTDALPRPGEHDDTRVGPAPTGPGDGLVADLSGLAAARLAAYKVPTRWSVRAEPFPRNASGKVMRARVL